MTCWASQAADDHAATQDAAEAHEAYLATFETDAADEVLCVEGNAVELIRDLAPLETQFLQVLWADPENAVHRICALRDALRAEVLKRNPGDVRTQCERLAKEYEADVDYSAGRDALDRFGFPSIRGAV